MHQNTHESFKAALTAKLAHTIPQAVHASGLSRSTLYDALKAGKLRARKSGRRTIIEDEELRRFIATLPMMGGVA
jgi:excisionase family DNA binding protein